MSMRLLISSVVLFMSSFSYSICSTVEGDSFEVVRGGFGSKPILWFKPKPDKHGKEPVDVAIKFLAYISKSDAKAAEELCNPRIEPDGTVRRSAIKSGIFDSYVESVNMVGITQIRMSVHAIRGKGGYWQVKMILDRENRPSKEVQLTLKKHNDVWKVEEYAMWYDYAMGKPNDWGL